MPGKTFWVIAAVGLVVFLTFVFMHRYWVLGL